MLAPPQEGAVCARSCAILAGGAGRRLGGSKASAQLCGRPLISFALETARAAGLQPFVVAKPDSALPSLDCELVLEPIQPQHPGLGLATALGRSPAPLVVVPCDLPLLPPQLLLRLAAVPGPLAVIAGAGSVQPLVGLYEPQLAARLRRGAIGGEPLREMIAALEPAVLDYAGLADRPAADVALHNVNTPADLEAAERLLAASR